MLKSGDHKDELAKDITHETDKLSVGFNFDVHYTNNWTYLKKFDSKTRYAAKCVILKNDQCLIHWAILHVKTMHPRTSINI